MKSHHILIAALTLCISLASCDDDSKIGGAITEDKVTVTVDSAFTATGVSSPIEKVQSRTVSQLIGRIDAPGYGSLSSDVVTQFMPASVIDTARININNIDSLVLVMAVAKGEYIGDSIAPLGIDVYRLDRQLPSPIYSNFDPEDYYKEDGLLASKIYNVSTNTAGYITTQGHTEIRVKLPLDFARSLYNEYLENPSTYNSPTAFAKFFPGLYIKNSFGSGRVSRVTSNLMSLYYHYDYHNPNTDRDTTLVGNGNYYAVTPEIITNNNVNMKVSPQIQQRVDAGEQIVMAPVGLEVKMRFPAPEIIAAYHADKNPVKVLNSLSFAIPGERVENDFNIPAPSYLLMVLSKDKDKFFADNSLPDNKTSFYATFNSSTGMYSFGEMRQYILDLINKGDVKEEDYTFSIVPVSCTFETQSSGSYYYPSTTQTLSLMTPYMASPVMAKISLDKAKIRLTFSSQTISK